jgi:hypothetical protein
MCSFTKIAFESKLFEQTKDGELFFGLTSFNSYLEENIFARFPICKLRAKQNKALWYNYFPKYAYMVKDEIHNALRNTTRQKRFLKRHF